jgi:hypothetical protein
VHSLNENWKWILILGIVLISSIAIGGFLLSNLIDNNGSPTNQSDNNGGDIQNNTLTPPNDTLSKLTGSISIGSIGTYSFNPSDVTTMRPDIFKEGYFSLFDILVFLDNTSQIEMDYHFNQSINTFVIKTINNISNWWYKAHYSGGWRENNVFRMDHYPYKDKMTITLETTTASVINAIHEVWREEIERNKTNDGQTIVPRVTIIGPPDEGTLEFYNISVTAHNLRNDTFQDGVVTAIDTILSLADQGKITTYKLKWYETIGTAEVVKTYYVEKINDWHAYWTCGFVYESGAEKFGRWQGNHIHIPSDIRIINSPEYVLYFWICL